MRFAGTATGVATIGIDGNWPKRSTIRRMKTRRHYLKFTDERKRTVRRFIIYGQYIPKGTDFSELTDEMLVEIEWKLNHRPRKSLGYRTPLEYCKQLFNFDF